MRDLLPNGVLGIAVTGLLAAFMAGMAANVSSFNTVFTNDIWAAYVKKGREDALLPATSAAWSPRSACWSAWARPSSPRRFSNIMNYLQTLFSFFNVPLFVRLHHRHVLEAGQRRGRLLGSARRHRRRDDQLLLALQAGRHRASPPTRAPTSSPRSWRSSSARVVMVAVTLFTKPKPAESLAGLVYGTTLARHGGAARRGRRRLVPQAGPARLGRDHPRRRSATSRSPSDT